MLLYSTKRTELSPVIITKFSTVGRNAYFDHYERNDH